MSSLSPVQEQQISRLVRREIKAQVAPTRQAIVQYRREIAGLKRQVRQQQRTLASLQSRKSNGSRQHETEIVNGLLEGIEQASRGDWVENPPDFEADLRKAKTALQKASRKKSKG